ncbi:MAG: hypothetical protein PHU07_00145 [Acidocella sp.]|nr:hypothetical protein [Acidocella sp.]
MTKQPLSPLSSIMPAKGEAAKVETLPEVTVPVHDNSVPAKEGRDTITVRITTRNNERLRIMGFKERMNKQTMLDEAIEEYLTRRGY